MARDIFQPGNPADLVPDYKLPANQPRPAREIGLTKVGGRQREDVLSLLDQYPVVDEAPASEAPRERTWGEAFTDAGKALAQGATQAAGAITRGIGDLPGRDWIRDAGAGMPLLRIAQAMGLLPKNPGLPSNPLEKPAAAIERQADEIGKSLTPMGQQLREQSRPKGDLTDPSTWSLGDDPTLAGYGLQAANTFGQFLPQLVTRWLPTTGVGMSAAQSQGAASKEARDLLTGMPVEQLRDGSPRFRELEQQLGDPEAAKARLVREAELLAGELTAPVGALGGLATGKLLAKGGGGAAERAVAGIGGVGGRLARAGVVGGVSGGEEAVQEVGEGVATRTGVNQATGLGLSVTEDSFGNAVQGFMGGAPGGAARGAMTPVTAPDVAPGDGAPVQPPPPGPPLLGGPPRRPALLPKDPVQPAEWELVDPNTPFPLEPNRQLPWERPGLPYDAPARIGMDAGPAALERPESVGPAFTVGPDGTVTPTTPDSRMADQSRAGDMARSEGWMQGAVDRMGAQDAAERARLGLTPDVERAQSARAEGPDVVGPQDIQFTGADGKQRPWMFRSGAEQAAKKLGGEVVGVPGGWVVRPQPTANPQAPQAGQPATKLAKLPKQPKVPRRVQWARENPFLNWLGRHGVKLELLPDITGERYGKGSKGRSNPTIPYYGKMFRRNGLNIDMLAERALMDGWLSQNEVNDPTDNGGTNRLMDMIARQMRGDPVLTGDDQIREMEAQLAEQEGELPGEMDAWDENGEYVGSGDADTDAEALAEREAIQAEADMPAEMATDDELDALIEAALYGRKGITDAELDQALGTDADAQPDADAAVGGQQEERDPGGAGEAVADGAGSRSDAGGEEAGADGADGFQLTGQTPEQVRQQQAAQERQQAEKARQDAAPPPEDFRLTGSDRDADVAAAAGQMELAPGRSGEDVRNEINAVLSEPGSGGDTLNFIEGEWVRQQAMLDNAAGIPGPSARERVEAAVKTKREGREVPRPRAPAAEAKPAEPAAGGDLFGGAPPKALAKPKKVKTPGPNARPLYVARKVAPETAKKLVEWAHKNGFKSTLKPEDLHVTIAYSRDPVDPADVEASENGDTLRVEGGWRRIEPLGDKGAIVLKFGNYDLENRWKQYRDAGASWDWSEYQPHITITYDGKGVDLSKVKRFVGPIVLGPEYTEDLDVDAADKVEEQPTPSLTQRANAAVTPKADEKGGLTDEQKAAIQKHGLPATTGFAEGRGALGRGKMMAMADGESSNLHATADAAAAELRQFLDMAKRRKGNEAARDKFSRVAAEKIRRGEQPTDAEWAAIIPGFEPGHRYARQPAISPFLTGYLGVSKAKIRASLGKAAGTVTSDSGAEYPIVYHKRLVDVFGPGATPPAEPSLTKRAEKAVESKAEPKPKKPRTPKRSAPTGADTFVEQVTGEQSSALRRNIVGNLFGSRRVARPDRTQDDALYDLRSILERDAAARGLPRAEAQGVEIHSVPYAARPIAAALRRMFGVEIVFVGGPATTHAELGFDGLYADDGKTIFVASGSTKPFHQVIGHEFLHWLADTNPDIFDGFVAKATPLLKSRKEAAAYGRARGQSYEQMGMDPARVRAAQWEELYADAFGDAWADPQFWRDLAVAMPRTLFQRLADKLRLFFLRVRLAVGLENANPLAADLFRDFGAVKAAVAEAMGQARPAQGQDVQPTPPVAKGFVRYYHGGVDTRGHTDSLWFSSDLRYAKGYAGKSGAAGRVFYVDVPKGEQERLFGYPLEPGMVYPSNVDLPKAIADRRQPFVEAGMPTRSAAPNASPWYSELARQIGAIAAKAQPAAGWKAAIKGLVNAGRVRADEVEWSGVEDWLDLQPGKVTKEQLRGFVESEGVQLSEVMLGEGSDGSKAILAAAEDIRETLQAGQVFDMDAEAALDQWISSDPGSRLWTQAEALLDEKLWDAGDNRTVADFVDVRSDTSDGTRYESWKIPGGTDYRELLITMPPKTRLAATTRGGTIKQVFDEPPTEEVRRALEATGLTIGPIRIDSDGFSSQHWDEPNVLAHVRMDTRTDADGKRVLFVNEIQSDWAQQGREKGFRKDTSAERAEAKKEIAGIEDDIENNSSELRMQEGLIQSLKRVADSLKDTESRHPVESRRAEAKAQRAELETMRQAALDKHGQLFKRGAELEGRLKNAKERLKAAEQAAAATSTAPFVGATDKWVALAIKRIIRHAAENGFDRVAFATGEQISDALNMTKVVDEITWSDADLASPRSPKKSVTLNTTDGAMTMRLDDAGTITWASNTLRDAVGKSLADVVGRAVADRILAERSGRLDADGMKLGGEGNRSFYDRIIPKVANDVLRRLGGGKVGSVTLTDMPGRVNDPANPDYNPAVQAGFDITPALRERAMGGLPMFSRREATARRSQRGGATRKADEQADDVMEAEWRTAGSADVERLIREEADGLTIIRWIAENALDPQMKRIATELAKTGVNPKVKIESLAAVSAQNGATTNGLYEGLTNTITLDEPKALDYVFVHEYVHAATIWALNLGVTPEARLIEDLFKQYKRASKGSRSYGFKDEHEFLAEALGNPGFMEELRALDPVNGQSLWQRLVAAIRRLLGLSKPMEDVLDTLLRAVPQLSADNAYALTRLKERFPEDYKDAAAKATRQSVRKAAATPTQQATQAAMRFLSREWFERYTEVLGSLPDRRFYIAQRGLAQGRIGEFERVGESIRKAFADANAKEKGQLYAYFTTADAKPDSIDNASMRKAAIETKRMIGVVGDKLVEAGMLTPESREKYRDQYLPRLYLSHLLSEGDWRAIGAGKKPSDMGYLKARKDIPEEVRRVILGEITNPEYLAAMAILRPMRDMTLLAFLEKISEREALVLKKSWMEWDGKKVTPLWVKAEAERLRYQARYMEDRDAAKEALALAERMDKAADPVMEALNAGDHTDWKKLPDTHRYGRLRGLHVRKEVYEDIVGVYELQPEDLRWWQPQSILGYGGVGTRVTQYWKFGKVALNPGSQVRNIVSNAVMLNLSGVPLHKVPLRIAQAFRQIRDKSGEGYRVAMRYGVSEATFVSQELAEITRDVIRVQLATTSQHPLRRITLMATAIAEKAGDFHQLMEVVGKTAKIIDEKARGATDEEAAFQAQKWMLDYTLVPQWVRYARNAPIGSPFLTWMFKTAPLMAEVARFHPWRFIPYIGIMASLPIFAAMAIGGDDDDWRTMKELLPEWARKRSHVVALPVRDSAGRIQFADLGPYLPWTMYTDFVHNLLRGEPATAATGLASSVFSGGPIGSLLAATTTGVDPFTDRPIVPPGEKGAGAAMAWASYLWTLAMPPIVTAQGAFAKGYQAATGTTNRYGDPRATGGQAAATLFGLNAYGINPDTTFAMEMSRMSREMQDTRIRMMQQLQDRGLSEAQRKSIIDKYTAQLREQADEAREYMQRAGTVSKELRVQTEPAR